MLNEKPENIRKQFIDVHKHPYIDETFYRDVISVDQITYFKKMLSAVTSTHKDILFLALLHMQTSLDIHDYIDWHDTPSQSSKRHHKNQLQILVGDYHSSSFYRLLSQNNMLNELYHFIEAIKEINELKMSVLHNDSKLNIVDQLIQVENIHLGLYDSLQSLYQIPHYQTQWKPLLVNNLVFNHKSCWADMLAQRFDNNFDEAIVNRKEYWNLLNYS